MISVISHEFDSSMTRGTVVVECDSSESNTAYEELRGPVARNMALKEAAVNGMADPRINDNPAIFAVDSKGDMVADPKVQKTHRYRARINVIRKLV